MPYDPATPDVTHHVWRISHRALWRHWLKALGGCVLTIYSQFIVANTLAIHAILGWFGLALILWGLLAIAYQRVAHRYLCTSERIVERHGIIGGRRTPLHHPDIRLTQIRQSFLGGLLGYGDVEIFSSGSGSEDAIFKGVANPFGVMQVIDQQRSVWRTKDVTN